MSQAHQKSIHPPTDRLKPGKKILVDRVPQLINQSMGRSTKNRGQSNHQISYPCPFEYPPERSFRFQLPCRSEFHRFSDDAPHSWWPTSTKTNQSCVRIHKSWKQNEMNQLPQSKQRFQNGNIIGRKNYRIESLSEKILSGIVQLTSFTEFNTNEVD